MQLTDYHVPGSSYRKVLVAFIWLQCMIQKNQQKFLKLYLMLVWALLDAGLDPMLQETKVSTVEQCVNH